MIQRLLVEGLFGKHDYDLHFHSDLNLLTGRNGCGKTTVMKLLWYAMSGNLHRIPVEIPIQRFRIETEMGYLDYRIQQSQHGPRLVASRPSQPAIDESSPHLLHRNTDPFPLHLTFDDAITIANKVTPSVYFPTFRRMECGVMNAGTVGDQLINLSRQMGSSRHRFIATLALYDMTNYMDAKLAVLSERAMADMTSAMSSTVAALTEPAGAGGIAVVPVQAADLRQRLSEALSRRDRIMRPFTVLNELAKRILGDKGVNLSKTVALGATRDALSSDKLSYGEMQMLGFLAYNAFTENGVIFIDEPEISLHPDWQRQLFKMLLSQGTGNQFIVATHSPMIYAKYADKDIPMVDDRGDADGGAEA